MTVNYKLFGEYLAGFLQQSDQSASWLARQVGVNRSQVGRWLDGESLPADRMTLDRINQALKLTQDQYHKLLRFAGYVVELKEAVGNSHYVAGPAFPLWVGVPRMPTYFIGREKLINDLAKKLCDGDIYVLCAEGLPGVGKTTLAVALAHHSKLLEHFSDGVLWASMGPQGDVVTALNRWADGLKLDLSNESLENRFAKIRDTIGQRKLLLVIDDIWHEENSRLLFCGGPNCVHLLTTRDQQIARSLAGTQNIYSVPILDEEASFTLLSALAPEACAAAPDLARKLVQQIGGLPLALEVLAGYLNEANHSYFTNLTTQAMSDLTDPALRLRYAIHRLGDAPNTKTTLEAVIRLSLDALPAVAASVFYALGAFAAKPAHFERIAAQQVAQADTKILALLISRNLLERIEGDQLSLHQILADFACTKLPPEVTQRHAEFYLESVKNSKEDWQTIEKLYDQVLYAWSQYMTSTNIDISFAIQYVNVLHNYQYIRGLYRDILDWNEFLLNKVQDQQDSDLTITQLHNVADAYLNVGDTDKAFEHAQQALTLASTTNNITGEGASLDQVGYIFYLWGKLGEAIEYYTRALQLMQNLDRHRDVANILIKLGRASRRIGEQQKALDYYTQGLAKLREFGDSRGEAIALYSIGLIYQHQGENKKALDCYENALSLLRAVGDINGEATVLGYIGLIYREHDELDKALEYNQKSLLLHRKIENVFGEGTELGNAGQIYTLLGESDTALSYYEQALLLSRKVKDSRIEAGILPNLGEIYLSFGDKRKALEYYEKAQSLQHASQDIDGEISSLSGLGNIYFLLGENDNAIRNYVQALSLAEKMEKTDSVIRIYNKIGGIYEVIGEKNKAKESYEQALSLTHHISNNVEHKAFTLDRLGGIYFDWGDRFKALNYFEQALVLSQQAGNVEYEAEALHGIGAVYDEIGEKRKALEFYARALKLRTSTGNARGEGATLNNIGKVYHDLGDMSKAFGYYRQALHLRHKSEDNAGEAQTLGNLGRLYALSDNANEALSHYNQALSLWRKIGDIDGEATVLNYIGNLRSASKRYGDAFDFYKKSLSLHRKTGNITGEAAVLNNIGHIHLAIREVNRALECCQQALSLWRKASDPTGEAVALDSLGQIYTFMDKKDTAVSYFESSLSLRRKASDARGERNTCMNMFFLFFSLGDWQQAIDQLQNIVALDQALGHPALESDRALLTDLQKKHYI